MSHTPGVVTGAAGVIGSHRAERLLTLGHDNLDDRLSIGELLSAATSLFERVHEPWLPGAQGRRGLHVREVRREPGGGLVVIYEVYAWPAGGRPRVSHRAHAGQHTRLASLVLDEQALDGTRIRFSARQLHHAPAEVQPPGIVRSRDLGLSVQAFPADGGLPALAASCDTTAQGPVFQALQSAACVQLCDDGWHLVAACAEPVRYHPASRCVIRYHLTLAHPHRTGDEHGAHRNLTLFGKVYAEPQQARFLETMLQRLYAEQVGAQAARPAGQSASAPFLPRPLGLVDALGLRFDAAVQPANGQAKPVLAGRQVLRPWVTREWAGGMTTAIIPSEELRSTALALARLHTSAVRPTEKPLRTGAVEARRACDRAIRIAARYPAQAQAVSQCARELAAHLEALHPDVYRPAHGAFKPSQLLFQGPHVVVVDFDGFCLADAALDVGYFLAYLRPLGLWYQRPDLRQWFEGAAAVFGGAYRAAMLERGVADAAIDGILDRARLYEGALLFKIAARRVNLLNSPRPQELSAMLGEIAACVAGERRRGASDSPCPVAQPQEYHGRRPSCGGSTPSPTRSVVTGAAGSINPHLTVHPTVHPRQEAAR